MERGAILPPVSIAVLQPAAPADTPQRSIAVTAIPLVHGASIRIRSIAEAKPAPAAVRLPTIMLTIRIATVRGFRTMRCGISVPRRARPAETLAMNTQTTPTPTVTESATTAARPSR
mgnify:CR=1 FL=1